MKAFCVFLASLACALAIAAQSSSTTYSRDVNGRRVYGTGYSSDGKGGEAKVYQNVNGRQVPLQQTSEKVLKQDAKSKTVERIVRNYDRDGRVVSTDRIVVEETKGTAGATSVRETQYRTEANGQTREVERRTLQTRVQGQTSTTDVVVERPGLSGSSFVQAERRSIVTTGPETRRQTIETVSRPAGNGTFQQERREETIVTRQGASVVTNTATYEPDASQRLALSQQTVATETKRPNGETVTETNIYGTAMAGRVYSPGTPLQIVEQRLVTQRVAPDGSVTEILNTRQPSLADPNRLGPPQFVAETTCVGKCLPPEEAPVQQAKAVAPKQDAKGPEQGQDKGKDQGKVADTAESPNQPKQAAGSVAAASKGPAPVEAKATPAPGAKGAGKAATKAPPAKEEPVNPPMPPPRPGDTPVI